MDRVIEMLETFEKNEICWGHIQECFSFNGTNLQSEKIEKIPCVDL